MKYESLQPLEAGPALPPLHERLASRIEVGDSMFPAFSSEDKKAEEEAEDMAEEDGGPDHFRGESVKAEEDLAEAEERYDLSDKSNEHGGACCFRALQAACERLSDAEYNA